MAGRFINMVRRDSKRIVSGSGWTIDIVLTDAGGTSYSVKATYKKHWSTMDNDGVPMRGKNATITVSEADLADKGYPVRNDSGEIDMANHTVNFADSSGDTSDYYIQNTLPDETLGIIVCILGDYTV